MIIGNLLQQTILCENALQHTGVRLEVESVVLRIVTFDTKLLTTITIIIYCNVLQYTGVLGFRIPLRFGVARGLSEVVYELSG